MRPELSGKPLVFVVGAFAHGKVRACVGWGCVVPARLLVWALALCPTAGIALRPGNALQLCSTVLLALHQPHARCPTNLCNR